jgi:hypothetical protein
MALPSRCQTENCIDNRNTRQSPAGAGHARRHRVKPHRAMMLCLFHWTLIVAGVFALGSGRIMHDVAGRSLAGRRSLAGTEVASGDGGRV